MYIYAFWKNILKPTSNSILEIAAGTGRLASPLIREGYNYTGLELSKIYCIHANKKLKKISINSSIIQGDMRSFNLGVRFDSILIPFNSLLHLLGEKDLIATLQSIKKHMHKNSILYIDIFVPHPLFLNRHNNIPEKRMEFYDSLNKKDSIVKETINFNSENVIVDVKWFYESERTVYHTFNFKMKMYYTDTMNRILIEQGFDILDLWGDYNFSPFSESSDLQIYKCRKAKNAQ